MSPKSTSPQYQCHVLYVDHNLHPAPLAVTYHATAARRLSSSVTRYPLSTTVQVDSLYCPNCMSSTYASTEVGPALAFGTMIGDAHGCPHATCQRCPWCWNLCRVQVRNQAAYFACASCDYTSHDHLSVVVHHDNDDGDLDKLELTRAANDLSKALLQRRQQEHDEAKQIFNDLMNRWQRRLGEVVDYNAERPPPRHRGDDGPWSLQALEEQLKGKKHQNQSVKVLAADVKYLSLEDNVRAHDAALLPPVGHSTLVSDAYHHHRMATTMLLPLPMTLRPRVVRRCKAELAAGRPGILLKPRLHPLEGDSGQRGGHGMWWKMDSSALHSIPHVTVAQMKQDGSNHAFLLRVQNPTLGPVKIKLGASHYTGEVSWDQDDSSSAIQKDTLLRNVLVDPFSQEHWTLQVLSPAVRDLAATSLIELQSAEDSILDNAGTTSTSTKLPSAVVDWHPTWTPARLALVACQSSQAWFELVGAIPPVENAAPCWPVALHIQVGAGSWESSLITPTQDGDGPDFVVLDLLVACKVASRSRMVADDFVKHSGGD